ncbi:hypothetical protein GCM10011583_66730 [Streptomyces camponoticapitis]|uniref:Uncharacterized protein n=1 Tax=Streptomyces camponoticapitis TaxID=1616125 RepID=A0ABQ2ETB5_9ACTN|nr:hypothetical protein [Streptomyces camponoticapitis]GGK25394.1 hypothetical protein GCM10011583_66730 [Streptomyces camponoticapitis]
MTAAGSPTTSTIAVLADTVRAATPPTTLVLAHWAYDGTGLTPDLERLAALIGGGPMRDQVVTARA